MKLVTYNGSDNPNETVFYTAAGTRLEKGRAVVVEDDDAKSLSDLDGHDFDVKDTKKKGVQAGDVILGDEVRGTTARASSPADEDDAAADTEVPPSTTGETS